MWYVLEWMDYFLGLLRHDLFDMALENSNYLIQILDM
jgi:hypothetical protein